MTHPVLKRSKLLALLVLLLLVISALVLAGCGGQASTSGGTSQTQSEAPIELKVAHFWPSTHEVETQIVQGWAKAVEQATNGRVKIVTYPGETLLKATAVYDGVVNGVADIGLSCYAYSRGRFPVMETLLQPAIPYKNSKVASKVAWDVIQTLNPKELQDTHTILVWGSGPGDLLMKNPVRSLADLKGVEIAVTGAPRDKEIQLLGGTAVTMPMSEIYESFSRGVVQGVLAPKENLKGFRLGEIANSVTETDFLYNQLFFMVMNLNKWNSLPPDIQEAITKTTEQFWNEKVIGLWDTINEAGMKWTQDNKPVEIIKLSEEERAKWVALIEPVLDEHVQKLNSQGLDGEQILKTVQDLAAKYNAQY